MADMQDYLKATDIIDWKNPGVLKKARELAGDFKDPVEIAKLCFEWYGMKYFTVTTMK